MMHMYTVIHLVHQQPCASVMGILGYTESITQQQGAVVRIPLVEVKNLAQQLWFQGLRTKNKHGKLDQCGHFLCWIMLNTYVYILLYIYIYYILYIIYIYIYIYIYIHIYIYQLIIVVHNVCWWHSFIATRSGTWVGGQLQSRLVARVVGIGIFEVGEPQTCAVGVDRTSSES